MAGKKRREDESTKNWISGEWKEILRWNKKYFFIVFEGLSFGETWKFDKKKRTQPLKVIQVIDILWQQ